ncbi:MAG: 2-oxoglutarate dehydrogenase E1 component [Chlamydiia bacterium]
MGLAFGENREHLEEQYAIWRQNPEQCSPEWRAFFEGMEFAGPGMASQATVEANAVVKAYRLYGHLAASSNPLREAVAPLQLDLASLGYTDPAMEVPSEGFFPEPTVPLSRLVEALRQTYCGSIGIEYMGSGSEVEAYIQQRIEPTRFHTEWTVQQKRALLEILNRTELFELFLHTKFTGQKRFSLEGTEALLPILQAVVDHGASLGLAQIVLGMAHRGRLNVLHTLLGRPISLVFHEFDESYVPYPFEGSGDVKYHKGFTGTITTATGAKVEVAAMANPSHLEAVDPVVEGFTRALQDRHGTIPLEAPPASVPKERRVVEMPLLIHGDASVAGQGVVYETLQMGGLRGYTTGGTLHVVINNQVGFTAAPEETRSTRYATDLARAFRCPVLHVNAEDAEACVEAARLAVELRQQFGVDVFIDLVGYRRYGHNEGDEPAFTQPLETQMIRAKESTRVLYRNRLMQEGLLEQKVAEEMEEKFRAELLQALQESGQYVKEPPTRKAAQGLEDPVWAQHVQTAALAAPPREGQLRALAQQLTTFPEGFTPHPKVKRLIEQRRKQLEEGIDWAWAEVLSLASLLTQGVPVRLSGQDVGRGTFSQRHAVWVDQSTGLPWSPLQHLSPSQAPFSVWNSHLSEYAVMGFEYGYSLLTPAQLVIWEAQFGDFANGAQILIDQFIAAGEKKWGRHSGLTLFLPHGYEGQGPEHSSGRPERFLQLCAEENLRVVVPSTPAQQYHLLREQALISPPHPLIVFTPKGLLRAPQATSSLDELAEGVFQHLIPDPRVMGSVTRLVFCTGKIWYELEALREQLQVTGLAIVRIEQLYPMPDLRTLLTELMPKKIVWVQEEPQNQGYWGYLRTRLPAGTEYCGRPAAAATATGSHAQHKAQQTALLRQALGLEA